MEIAEKVSERATCDRKHVGAVIVRDNRILATGYNGSIKGAKHCDDVDHLIEDNHCIRTIHGEINAITQCARYGIECDGAEIYVNTFPCWNCFKTIVNSGIKKIYYRDDYNCDLKGNVYTYAILLHFQITKIS